MNMLLERPAAAGRIGEDPSRLDALKASVVNGDIRGIELTELRMQCDRELRELQTEFEMLIRELKLALQRMQADRRVVRRAA